MATVLPRRRAWDAASQLLAGCSRSAARTPTFTTAAARPRRPYHSHEHPAPAGPFSSAAEQAILRAALARVPELGFTPAALAAGARAAGYLDISTNLFPRGAFALVHFHLLEQRRKLADDLAARVAAEDAASEQAADAGDKPWQALGVGARVKDLTWRRLLGNKDVIHKWQEALAVMAQPSNMPAALAELHALSDDIWYLSGDTAVDFSWYTKRASLSAVYAATDVFMTTDRSPEFRDTAEYFDRRLADLRTVGSAISGLGMWSGFAASQAVNTLRSKGVRI